MKLNFIHNSQAPKINRRGGDISLHKHEISGTSDDRMIGRLGVVCASNNGNGPNMPLYPQTDLCHGNALKSIQTRRDRSPFRRSDNFRRLVCSNRQRILEHKKGAERGGSLGDTRSSDTVHYDVPRSIDGFMLEEGEVEGLETLMVVVVVRRWRLRGGSIT